MSYQVVGDTFPPGFKIVTLQKGTELYKQSHEPIDIVEEPLSGNQWFSFVSGYAESYGPHEMKFKLARDVRLIDVAKTDCRNAVTEYAIANKKVDESCINTNDPLRPLESAWGEGCNKQAAETVCGVAAMFNLDGWIAKEWDDYKMKGPEEVMLCFGDGDNSLLSIVTL